VAERLRQVAERRPDAPALLTPSAPPLTYGELIVHLERLSETLAEHGLDPNDPVALLAGAWGPEVAVATLAIAMRNAVVVLNPAFTHYELRRHLVQSRAKAVVVRAGFEAVAGGVPAELGVPVIRLVAEASADGWHLELEPPVRAANRPVRPAQSRDAAIIASTTGTTGRPRLMVWTHRHLAITAEVYRGEVALGPGDVFLGLMPAYSSGALYALTRQLTAGAALLCPRELEPSAIVDMIGDYGVTSYVGYLAVIRPALEKARQSPELAARWKLRLIMTGGSPLSSVEIEDIEAATGARLWSAYAMSEASGIAIMPIGMAAQKPKAVGLPALDLRIVDDKGADLPKGSIGQIVIRGPQVIEGYLDDPAANQASFRGGWFHTGDLGFLDEDGYLSLAGRVKEQISRGGEKVSPMEVEEALMAHPAIRDAAAFAIPHRRLGEEVGAAVVSSDPSLSEAIVRDHALSMLAPNKVPRRVIFVESIPRPTGKTPRLGMAERLGLGLNRTPNPRSRPPATTTELRVAAIWQKLLETDTELAREDDFFDLGGESILAVTMQLEIENAFGVRLPQSVFLESAKLDHIASAIDASVAGSPAVESLVAVQLQGEDPPLFWVPGGLGGVLGIRSLAFHLGSHQPVYGFQPPGIDGKGEASFKPEKLAAGYVALMREVQPTGPYRIGGHSFGGLIAFEMARQLEAAGESVSLLALVDAACPGDRSVPEILEMKVRWAHQQIRALSRMEAKERNSWLAQYLARQPRRVSAFLRRPEATADLLRPGVDLTPELMAVVDHAMDDYSPQPYRGDACLFVAASALLPDLAQRWRGWISGSLDVETIPGTHDTCVREPQLGELAQKLRQRLHDLQVAALPA